MKKKKRPGYIYVLTHPRKPNIVKVGACMITVRQRIDELNARAGLLGSYEDYFHVSVPAKALKSVETAIHRKLSQASVPHAKEEFAVKPDVAKSVVDEMVSQHLELHPEEEEAVEESKEKKSPIKHREMRLIESCQHLGQLIEQTRVDAQIERSDLASRLDLPESAIRALESGEQTAFLGYLFKVMAALDIQLNFLK